jgi:predicted AAA+ superfamily ATPase
LWGELAWQLGGAESFAFVTEADATGTSPGKDVLRELLEHHAPCVVLIDELVAYVPLPGMPTAFEPERRVL